MTKKENPVILFLKDLMERKDRLPSQLAADLGVNHSTVIRWLSGNNVPDTNSCKRLADYSGVPLEKIFHIMGYLPVKTKTALPEWPEFREYATQKYSRELDDDLITMIEAIIKRRRKKIYGKTGL